jgi:glycosyltransferase involved in cell wall biosynthesis
LQHDPDVTIVLLDARDRAGLARATSDARAQRGVIAEVVTASDGSLPDRCDAAVRAARGRWVAFLEAGDRWHPDRLQALVGAAEARDAAWAYGARILLGAGDRVIGVALAPDPDGLAERLRGGNVVGGPSSVLCRRELLSTQAPFDPRLQVLTFWRAWLALAGGGIPAACPEPLCAERLEHGDLLRDPRRGLEELRLLEDEGLLAVAAVWQERRLAAELVELGRRGAAAATLTACALKHRRPQDLLRAARAAYAPPARDRGYLRPAWLDGAERPAGRRAPRGAGTCEVSVVIATRDRPAFLRQAVASALRQVDVDLEVIVVDDASTKPEATHALSFEDPRVRVHVRRRSGGAGPARDEAVGLARGDWVAFLDDDDLFAPTRLRAQLDGAGSAGFAFCGQVLVDPARAAVGTLPAPAASDLAERLRARSAIGGPSAVMVRTELLREVGGFGAGYYALGDWDLWLRLAAHAQAAATAELLVGYTIHASNMHLRAPERVLADYARLARAHGLGARGELELLDWLARDLTEAGRSRAAARLHLRAAFRHRRPLALLRALRAHRRPDADPVEPPRLVGPEWLRLYGPVDGG